MSSHAFKRCCECGVERLAHTLTKSGVCPFCITHDAPVTVATAAEPLVKPDKRKKPAPPSKPAPPIDGTPYTSTPTDPYTKPAFDTARAAANPEQELAARVLCRRRLLPFIKRFRPKYTAGWVHEDICRRLERFVKAVENGEEPRLLLMCPPRAGKSEIGSRNFPAWVLGQHPDWEIIAASHTGSLTMSFSRYIRDLLRDPAYQVVFPDAALDPSSQSVENWNLTSGGGYLAAGVGTGITGRGAHILLLDDLVKDIEAADSPTIKENTWEWYISTAYSRLAPGGGVLGIMCMTGDTLITMANGARRRIDMVIPGEKVLSWDNGCQKHSTVAAIHPQGEDDVLELRTGNHCVRANARHPFLTPKGWVRMKDLLVGDTLIVTGAESTSNTRVLTATEAWLLGVMFGDGWAKKGIKKSWDKARLKHYLSERAYCGCAISLDDELTERIITAFKTAFGVTPKQHSGAKALRCDLKRVAEWFIAHGLNGTAHTKRVPEWIFSESFDNRTAFLDGFCAADGHENVPKGKSVLRMRVNLCNRDLIEDIRQLARSLGYSPTNVHTQHRMYQPPGSPVPIAASLHNVQWQSSENSRNVTEFSTTTIRSIRPAGRAQVYDLSIEGTHNFIADGIVSHNTWWSEDDWAGRIQQVMKMDDGGDKFEIVRYPALNEEGDEYILLDDSIAEIPPNSDIPEGARMTRPHNTALHPARYTTAALQRIKSNYIAAGLKRMWQSLYQQNPTPDDGIYFSKEMLKFYTHNPRVSPHTIYQAWDFAISEKAQNDYTVCATILQDSNDDVYVLDILRFKSSDGNNIVEMMIDQAEAWQPQAIGVEDGQIWKTMSSQYQKRCKERRMYTPFEILVPLTDKMVRANPLRGRMQLGKVFFDKTKSWAEPLIRELMVFPAGKHDDQVDALAWAIRLSLLHSAPKSKTAPALKSWKDNLRLLNITSSGHMSA